MKTARIETNETCNQNCTYCNGRASSNDPARVHPAAVQERIASAVKDGARSLVFTGGEPLLRKDLEVLVASARQEGAETVCVETNATLVTAARARALGDAGVSLARVNLSGAGPGLDAVTRDPGGWSMALAGIQALIDAGIKVEIAAAVVASTQALLPGLPAALHEIFGAALRTLRVTVPVEAPSAAELLSYEAASRILAELDRAGRRVGIRVQLRPDSGPPPCVPAAAGSRLTNLYALSSGGKSRPGFQQVEGCANCLIADRCPGFASAYLAARPLPPMMSITDDRQRRRLSRAEDVEGQIRRELVAISRRSMPGVGEIQDEIVRVHFHCNEACRFCFVSTHLPPPAPQAVIEAIVRAGERGARISLSGGEPGLNPRLPEYVKLATEASTHPVELQTNAVPMADMSLARALADAGLSEALVSLHASTAELSEAITRSPGSFERTVAGIDNLRAEGIQVTLNFVIHGANQTELPAFVGFVASRWPDAYLNVSFVHAASDVVPRERELLPRYSDTMPSLLEALAEAERLGLKLTGFQSLCGLPLCLVPAQIRDQLELPELTLGTEASEMVKSEVCQGCSLERRCHGVRSGYAALYGMDELSPLPAKSGVVVM